MWAGFHVLFIKQWGVLFFWSQKPSSATASHAVFHNKQKGREKVVLLPSHVILTSLNLCLSQPRALEARSPSSNPWVSCPHCRAIHQAAPTLESWSPQVQKNWHRCRKSRSISSSPQSAEWAVAVARILQIMFAAMLSSRQPMEQMNISEIFVKHNRTLKTTPQRACVCVCMCMCVCVCVCSDPVSLWN